MFTVYGYVPAWGLPDISPYVTKLVHYLTFAGLPQEWKAQNLATLDEDSPTGLREIDALSGTRLPDLVVDYLERRVRER